MSQVTYVGPLPEAVVWLNDEEFVVVHPQGVYDVPEDVAANLIEQGVAVHAAASGTGQPPKRVTVDEWAAYRVSQGHDVTDLTKQQLIDLPDTPAHMEA